MDKVSISNLKFQSDICYTLRNYLVKCNFEGKNYCFKEIIGNDSNYVLSNIENLFTNIDSLSNNLIIPKLLVCRKENKKIGYLTEYVFGCKTLEKSFDLDYDEKVKILRRVKKLILELNENGIVHGDLHLNNICLDIKLNPYIIDFDYCNINRPDRMTAIAREYLNNNEYDCGLDTHLFNITSYCFLNNIGYRDAFWFMNQETNFTNKAYKKELKKIINNKKSEDYLVDLL